MARNQRKEEILKSELPPALPLMALRSTIVYPLGTIAVQMGAPENLALLRANEEPGLIVALVVASGDHDEPVEPGKFVGRVGVAARVHERINLPGDTVQITLQGLRRITVEAIEQTQPYAIASIKAARETPAEPAELEDLVARVVSAAETLADLVDRIPDEVPQILKMNVSDPGRFADLAATNMNFRISDKDEVLQRLDVGQRIRFILSRGREASDRDQDRAAPARVLPAPAAACDPGGARGGRPGREGSARDAQEDRRGEAAGESRAGSAAGDRATAHAVAGVERIPGDPHVPRLDPVTAVAQALGR
jgi:ATP-dependent Lon protease